jgi:hypothetical protein
MKYRYFSIIIESDLKVNFNYKIFKLLILNKYEKLFLHIYIYFL